MLHTAICTVYGIPEEIIAYNMPFNNKEFKLFAKNNITRITTSSPTHSQSDGLAERTIQTVQRILYKAYEDGKDESIALLEYRNTPISDCDYSPAQLLFNRRLRDKMPIKSRLLMPEIAAREQFCKRQEKTKILLGQTCKKIATS